MVERERAPSAVVTDLGGQVEGVVVLVEDPQRATLRAQDPADLVQDLPCGGVEVERVPQGLRDRVQQVDLLVPCGELDREEADLARRLAKWGLRARTITLKTRFQDFTTITRSHTPTVPVSTLDEIHRVAGLLTDRVPLDGRRIRLVGLGGTNLVKPGAPREAVAPGRSGQLALWPES